MRVSPSMGAEAGGTLVSLYGEAFAEPLSCRYPPNPSPLTFFFFITLKPRVSPDP